MSTDKTQKDLRPDAESPPTALVVEDSEHVAYLLEYMLELGIIGTTMFMVMYVRAVVRATRYVRAVPGIIGLWPLTILTYTLLYSITEVGVQGRTI